MKINFQDVLRQLATEYKDYHYDGYVFLHRASNPYAIDEDLNTTQDISLIEFYQEVIDAAIDIYGPLAYTIMNYWGFKSNKDIKCAVSRMIKAGLLRKTKGERLRDLEELPSLQQFLELPFIPKSVMEDEFRRFQKENAQR